MYKKQIAVAAIIFTVLLIPVFSCKTKKAALDCSAVGASYVTDIQPIIQANCYKCHGAGSRKGDFTTYDGLKKVIDSGEFEKRVLIKQSMPPTGPLAENLRKQIRCWLNNGAPNN